jgi:hypothetical protein
VIPEVGSRGRYSHNARHDLVRFAEVSLNHTPSESMFFYRVCNVPGTLALSIYEMKRKIDGMKRDLGIL